MEKVKGLPGTPEEESTESDDSKDYESQAKSWVDRSFENSHANLMNEGDDDNFQRMVTRSRIRSRRES